MNKTIAIDGIKTKTINAYSSGPNCTPHSYDIGCGCYVERIGNVWWLFQPGQSKRVVNVVA
jgi:hypothetical protein